MTRRKVGILTFHHVNNYGGMLQALALGKAVESLGHSAVIVDYRLPKAVRVYRRWGLRTRYCLHALVRQVRFETFLRKNAQLSCSSYRSSAELKSGPPDVDAIVVGSDQVWNTHSWRGYDSTFFLDWAEEMNLRRIGYAVSAGDAKGFSPHEEEIVPLIKRFDCLSAREEATGKLISETCGLNPEIVCDPVFLHQFDVIRKCSPINSDYFLVHSLETTPLLEHIIALRRTRDRLRPISVYSVRPPKGVYRHCAAAGPAEWLNLIFHSRYVVTNSFHAICFCLLFQKPFVVPARTHNQGRISHLLTTTGTQKQAFADQETFELQHEHDLFNINWNIVSTNLGKYVKHSNLFLSSSLS